MGELWLPDGVREDKKIEEPGAPVEPGKVEGEDVDMPPKAELTEFQEAQVEGINKTFSKDPDILAYFLTQPPVMALMMDIIHPQIANMTVQVQHADRKNVFLNVKKSMEDGLARQTVAKGTPGLRMLDAFTVMETVKVVGLVLQQLPPVNLQVQPVDKDAQEGEAPEKEATDVDQA